MSKNTTRRLFAVVVALLVVFSFAGGPAATAAAATGTVGEDIDTELSGEDSGSNTSDSDSSDGSATDGDGSNGDSANEGSTDDRDDAENSSNDGLTEDDSGDSTATDGSSEEDSAESDERSAENVTDAVEATANATTSAVASTTDGVDGTIEDSAATSFTLVERVSQSSGLQNTLGIPMTGLEETERVGSQYDGAAERTGPATTDGETTDAAESSTDSAGPVTLVGMVGQDAAATFTGSDDGSQPLPAGLSGGATLGLGALAAVAVARSTPLFAGATTSGSGSATTGYLATLLDKVKPFVFPLRYSRYDDSDPLEHEARELVYEIVNETPGSYLSEVSERADLPLSTTRHHMKVLEREELVSGAKLRGKRRFYPAYAEGIELAAALNDDSTASIIDALARLGAASVSDLADDLGRDPSTISHHLQRLEEDDIITREREGRAVMNKLSGEARTAMAPETTPRPGEAAEALAD